MADNATKRSLSLKSGKTINFLENHYQKHILSPVWYDQHPETHSLVLGYHLIPLRIGALSGDDTPQSPGLF